MNYESFLRASFFDHFVEDLDYFKNCVLILCFDIMIILLRFVIFQTCFSHHGQIIYTVRFAQFRIMKAKNRMGLADNGQKY